MPVINNTLCRTSRRRCFSKQLHQSRINWAGLGSQICTSDIHYFEIDTTSEVQIGNLIFIMEFTHRTTTSQRWRHVSNLNYHKNTPSYSLTALDKGSSRCGQNRKVYWKQATEQQSNGSYFVDEGVVPEHDMEMCGSKLRGRTKHNKGAVKYLGNHHQCNRSDMEISYWSIEW